MAQDPRKRQQKLQRKATKRKQKRTQVAQLVHQLTTPSLNKAKTWPLREVWLSKEWRDSESLTQIVVARQGPSDLVAIGNFLVDQGSLGVKNAFGRVVNESDYKEYVKGMRERQALIKSDLDLVAKIIREAIAYAKALGFQPNKDTGQAMQMLGGADPDACSVTIPLGGKDGRPFYFGGPYDNYDRIIRTLTKAVGPDGFTYVVPLGEDQPEWGDSVEFDEDE